MGKSRNKKRKANTSPEVSGSSNNNLSDMSNNSVNNVSGGHNKTFLSHIISAANNVLYGSQNNDTRDAEGGKQQGDRPFVTSTPKWRPTESDTSVEKLMGTVLETNQKLDFVLNKLDELSNIKSVTEKLTVQVSNLEKRVGVLESTSNDHTESLDFLSHKVDEFGKEKTSVNSGAERELMRQEKMIENLHKSIDDLRRSREGLQEKVSELQWRSMKNNLVFTGLGNETRDEDTEAKLRDFLRIELNISHHIEFGSVHRFGKYRNDGRRPIVARFIYAQDRTMVKDRGYMLKNKPYGIQEQLPADMSERRRHLLPVMHRLRAEGKRVKLV